MNVNNQFSRSNARAASCPTPEDRASAITAGHDYGISALRDRLRLVYEARKFVSLNFFLDCCKQD
jgi:hypothetical protein